MHPTRRVLATAAAAVVVAARRGRVGRDDRVVRRPAGRERGPRQHPRAAGFARRLRLADEAGDRAPAIHPRRARRPAGARARARHARVEAAGPEIAITPGR